MHRYLVTRKPEPTPEATLERCFDTRESLLQMKALWGISDLKKSPSGRPSNQYVWDEKCIRLLQRMAASGLDVASLPPKPVMPKCWHRDSEGPLVEIATEPLEMTLSRVLCN